MTNKEKCNIETKEDKTIMWDYKHYCKTHNRTWYNCNPKETKCPNIEDKIKEVLR